MTYQTDRVAILLATYNGAEYLGEQLDSLLAQTYTDWTAYIHDDGSQDATLEVIDAYVKKYPEHFVCVEGEPTGGARNNFFYLLKRVEAGEYLFCDQDDVWLPDKIEKTVQRMRETPSGEAPRLVFTELTVADENLQVIAERMSSYQALDCTKTGINRLIIQNVITGCTVMINRPLRDRILLVRHMDKIVMHDWWAGLIASLYGSISFVEEPTILYRQHRENSVGAIDFHNKSYLLKKAKTPDRIRLSLKKTRLQAEELVEVFGLPADSLCAGYARLDEKNKLQRLRFYRKNDIKKTNLLRNVGLVLWG